MSGRQNSVGAKKILITGGAGFIGSHLAESLLKQGRQVTVIDDLSTGRYVNVAHLEHAKGFRLIIDTVLNDGLMERLLAEHDGVFHLASAVGVALILDQPVRTIQNDLRWYGCRAALLCSLS